MSIKINQIKRFRDAMGLSQSKFASHFHIPVANVQKWEQGLSNPPEYVEYMIEKLIDYEQLQK